MKKLSQLNLGKPLSRDEQKQIKGGTPICLVGAYAECFCKIGCSIYVPGDGVHTTAILCGYPYTGQTPCGYQGVLNPGGCYSAPGSNQCQS